MLKKKVSIKQEESQKNSFIIMYDWLTMLRPSDSAMLAYLIDAEDIATATWEEDEDYFMCTYNFLKAKCIGWSDQNVKTALKSLQSQGIIDIKNIREGSHTPRYIKINHDKIRELKENWKQAKKEFG